ncbi:MAG: hypothetical protein RLZZ628_1734 [Bacteroidota bacterium]|jgi:hypothetical protein
MDSQALVILRKKILEGLELSARKMLEKKQKEGAQLAFADENGKVIIVNAVDLTF